MIRLVEALRYRCLRYVNQPLDQFQVLVGPNASGKSTFLDVVALLGDIVRNGPAAAVDERALEIRQLSFLRATDSFELAVEAEIPQHLRELLANGKLSRCRYEVAVGAGAGGETTLLAETLWLAPSPDSPAPDPQGSLFPRPPDPPETIVVAPRKHSPGGWKKIVSKVTESGNDYFQSETTGWNNLFRLGPKKSSLANLPEDETKFPVATWFKRSLIEGVQRLALSSEAMRKPSPQGKPRAFLPDGSNLPWVVDALDPESTRRWLKHIRTALPDLSAISTVERPEDRNRYLVLEFENGLKAPSWLLSDGTLRLLALTLLAYVPGLTGAFLVEEPENGIHPRAAETAFQSLSSTYGAQILCATHSPVMVSMARPEQILCFAKAAEGHSSGATAIVRGSEHPRLREWKGEVDLGTLFASGVLG